MNELSTLPAYDAKRFYRRIAELTEKYFEIPENKRKFEEWKRSRERPVCRSECGNENGKLKMENGGKHK